jgi:lipid II:glycine glycyltransferase (peptidoglycan interpeptide bridge formation enzyme)
MNEMELERLDLEKETNKVDENLQKAQTLTDELKKASERAKEQLDEFEKITAQREIEEQKESEAGDEEKTNSLPVVAAVIILGAVIGFFGVKWYKNSHTSVKEEINGQG